MMRTYIIDSKFVSKGENMYQNNFRDELRFLSRIGVDTRFLSFYNKNIHINNQRFSRFTKQRQELFLKNYSEYNIHSSKIFQKICTRASRVLARSLKPREKIFIEENDICTAFLLEILLEPYTRKYGIEILMGQYGNISPDEFNSIAMPTTLDDEAVFVLNKIFNGEKIDVFHLKNKLNFENQRKLIYPLQNVPISWIELWIEKLGYECEFTGEMNIEMETLNFIEDFIPNVRENILKSALFISENSIIKNKQKIT